MVVSAGITLNVNTFEDLLGGILSLNIDVTSSNQVNSTHYIVDIIGKDGQLIISPEDLAFLIEGLTVEQRQSLQDAGIDIVQVTSNAPVATPTSAVPARPIPAWAVAVIVVLNSVIIIAVLLIVLLIMCRRYRR